mmetsp:Transcript_16110/g.31566  ORF Transcript_16110/g.31566 Transcript_16110/m.31566 type:complete len:355 (-) Transcript_16110:313-1377(-)
MAGIFNGPLRGGTRGGKDQFKWEDVKNSKDREYYLGHSVKASQGRWQKNKDLNWMNKESSTLKQAEQSGLTGKALFAAMQKELAAERQAFKEKEEQMRLEALGLKPRTVRREQLDDEEREKLLRRGGSERDDTQAAERIEGVGGAPSRSQTSLEDKLAHARDLHDKVAKGELDASVLKTLGPSQAPERLEAVGTIGAALPPSMKRAVTVAERKKDEKRSEKQAKKDKKAEDKAAKHLKELEELDTQIAALKAKKSAKRQKLNSKEKAVDKSDRGRSRSPRGRGRSSSPQQRKNRSHSTGRGRSGSRGRRSSSRGRRERRGRSRDRTRRRDRSNSTKRRDRPRSRSRGKRSRSRD